MSRAEVPGGTANGEHYGNPNVGSAGLSGSITGDLGAGRHTGVFGICDSADLRRRGNDSDADAAGGLACISGAAKPDELDRVGAVTDRGSNRIRVPIGIAREVSPARRAHRRGKWRGRARHRPYRVHRRAGPRCKSDRQHGCLGRAICRRGCLSAGDVEFRPLGGH